MKEFKAINAGEGAMIHAQLLEMTTLPQHQWLGVVVQDHVLTLVPGERSAMDIINVIKDLKELQEALLKKIADACGKCDRCEEREACELVDANTFSPAIKISPELLRDAGIDPGSKLICLPEDEEGVLHITAADYRFDLTDVPPDILQQLRERNVCLDDLEDLLMSEDVVKEVCDGR